MSKKILIGIFSFFLFGSYSFADEIHLATEEYPPFNIKKISTNKSSHTATGISVDIIQELFKRENIEYTLEFLPWIRAYNYGLKKPDYGVFSTFLTPERKPLFRWVGPLVPNNWILMGKKSKYFKIKSLKDACKYNIGGYRGDAIATFLEKKGCSVQYTSYDHQNALKLDLDRIDLWATGKLLGPYLAKKNGVSGLVEVFMIKESPMYLALNRSFSEEFVEKLNKTLQKMKEDGTVEKIYKNYK